MSTHFKIQQSTPQPLSYMYAQSTLSFNHFLFFFSWRKKIADVPRIGHFARSVNPRIRARLPPSKRKPNIALAVQIYCAAQKPCIRYSANQYKPTAAFYLKRWLAVACRRHQCSPSKFHSASSGCPSTSTTLRTPLLRLYQPSFDAV